MMQLTFANGNVKNPISLALNVPTTVGNQTCNLADVHKTEKLPLTLNRLLLNSEICKMLADSVDLVTLTRAVK